MFGKLKSSIKESLAKGDKTIVLSFKEGSSFFENEDLKQDLGNGNLVYLQIKPSLLTRMPYFEDHSPIFHDIEDLLPDSSLSRVLFLESPEVVIDIKAQDRMTSTSILFAKMLNSNFKAVHYFAQASSDARLAANLNAMAKILIAE